jgi:hypothetical protein
MTIIDITPHLKTVPPADKRAEIEALAREFGGVVLWPDDALPQTIYDRALSALGYRVPLTPQDVAERLFISRDYARRLLGALKKQGKAQRVGHYHRGGWLRVAVIEEQQIAA